MRPSMSEGQGRPVPRRPDKLCRLWCAAPSQCHGTTKWMASNATSESWLNRTTIGIGLTSLFSDWSHEIATAILPAFLATIGAGPAWLGAIEGTADGLSSFVKLAAGHLTDRLKRRKPLAVAGYAVTTLATASFAFATRAYQLLAGRAAAWL